MFASCPFFFWFSKLRSLVPKWEIASMWEYSHTTFSSSCGLLRPLNCEAEKRVTILAQVLNNDYTTEIIGRSKGYI